MATRIKVAKRSDVEEGRPKAVHLDDLEIALYRIGDAFYATSANCPHAWGPLVAGDQEGSEIICPLHGWSFDIPTGRCTNIDGPSVATFVIDVEGDDLFLVRDAHGGDAESSDSTQSQTPPRDTSSREDDPS